MERLEFDLNVISAPIDTREIVVRILGRASSTFLVENLAMREHIAAYHEQTLYSMARCKYSL